jgi:ABC-2 type transport system permease protein
MLKLLKIEWMKIKNYKVFMVFSVLYAICVLAILFIFYKVYQNSFSGDEAGEMIKSLFNPFSFPIVWTNAGFFLSMLLYFPGIIIITFCVNEFTFKTHRQNIIDGYSRKEFLLGKLLLILSFAIAVTALYVLGIFLFSKISNIEFSFNGAKVIGYVFIQTLHYLLFAFLLAILFRKSGVAVILFLIYGVVIESILVNLINWKTSPVGDFMPLQVADRLTPFFPRENTNPFYSSGYLPETMVWVTVLYSAIFVFVAYKKFVKDDL